MYKRIDPGPYYYKDDILICNQCKTHIATAARDCWLGEILDPSQFIFPPEHVYEYGARWICWRCQNELDKGLVRKYKFKPKRD